MLLQLRKPMAAGVDTEPLDDESHSLALRSDGTVWSWGSNTDNQLGGTTFGDRLIPGMVTGVTGITAVAAGNAYSLALKNDGTVWSWGRNTHGQLGDGTTTRGSPAQIPGLFNVTAVAASFSHSVAVKADGTVWAWGYNLQGQLGDGTASYSTLPLQALLP